MYNAGIMGPNIAIEENWTPEPELFERPPRRVVASDYPDLNGVNMPLFLGVGAVLLLAGAGLFVGGLAKGAGATIAGGLFLTGLGIVAVVFFPIRQKQHLERAEHLVTNGVPVVARLLSAEPLNGSATARALKYQITGKDGDIVHREVNADDSVLPKRVPCQITALMDMASGDAELYLALPFRAVARTSSAVAAETPVVPVETNMGTVSPTVIPTPVRVEKPKVEEEEKPKRETYE